MRARKSKSYPSSYKRPEVAPKDQEDHEVEKSSTESEEKVNLYVPITKADEEKKIVTGVVLEPDTVDAQGDSIPPEVIEKAAHQFLSGYNLQNTLGFAHKVFKKNFDLLESFVAPQEMRIGEQVVKAGSWVMSVRVLNNEIWGLVKGGQITGFSIGGRAKSKPISE